jgi:hypothetical protein
MTFQCYIMTERQRSVMATVAPFCRKGARPRTVLIDRRLPISATGVSCLGTLAADLVRQISCSRELAWSGCITAERGDYYKALASARANAWAPAATAAASIGPIRTGTAAAR